MSSPPGRSAAAGWLLLAVALFIVSLGIGFPGLRGAYYFNDVEHFNLPVRSFFADGWRQGELRLWCPEAGAGYPLFAEGQAGPAYAGNLLFAVIRPTWLAYSWSVVLHLWWAGLGVALLLLAFGCRRSAAFAGGVAFMLSGPVWFRVIHLNFLHGLAWLPWVAIGLERGLRRQRYGFGLAGVALAMQILAGHAHPPLLSGLMAPLYVLGRGRQVHEPDRAGSWQVPAALAGLLILCGAAMGSSAARWLLLPGLIGAAFSLRGLLTTPERRAYAASFAGLGTAFALAALLAAVQILPLLELVPHTARQHGVDTARAQDAELTLTWARLGTLLLPRLHGSTYQEDVGEKIRWDLATHWEHAAHVGILTVLLLVLAPLAGRRRERWVFLGLAVVALLLAMGRAFPFYGWLMHLPGWGGVRGPARLLGLFAFAAAVVAGLVIDDLANHGLPEGRDRKRINLLLFPTALLGVLAAVAMIVTVAGHAPFTPTHAAAYTLAWVRMAALLVCGALLIGSRKSAAASPGWGALAAALMLLDLVSGSSGYHRVKPPSYYDRPADAAAVTADPAARVELGVYAGHPLQANRHLLYPPVSNAAIYTPLALSRQQVVEQMLREKEDPEVVARWRSLLRIAYAWSQPDGRPGFLAPTATPDGEPLPRFPEVWTTPLWRSVRSGREALALTVEETWQPQAYAVLESAVAPAPRQGQIGEVLWSEIGRHRLTCRVTSRSPQVLVVGQCAYPGWQVHRDGAWQPAERVDYLFFGAKLPAGVHRVDCVFRPVSIRLGMFLSLCGLAIVAAGVRRRA